MSSRSRQFELPDDHVLITMTAEMRDMIHRVLTDEAKYPHSMFATLTNGQHGTTQVMPLVQEVLALFAPPTPPEPVYQVVKQITYEGTLAQLAKLDDFAFAEPRTYQFIDDGATIRVETTQDTRPLTEELTDQRRREQAVEYLEGTMGPDLSVDPDSLPRVD